MRIFFTNIFTLWIPEGGRLSADGLLFIGQLFKEFPNSRIIVVFTKVRKSFASNDEMKKTFNKEISDFLQKADNRWVVIPNLDFYGDSERKMTIKNKIDELKKKIMEIDNEASGIGPYLYNLFDHLSKCEIL